MNPLRSHILRHTAVRVGCSLLAALAVAAAPAATPASAPAARPMQVREGPRLSVPADSPLRSRLIVAAVGEQASPSGIALPAIVEAEPDRTVNLLPPLTGRLLQLNARLGDTVKRGQLLATLVSGDHAQAVADRSKARDGLDLAQKALTRAQAVNLTGSNAAKDVESAQSAVVQNQAELGRSEARLRALGAGGAGGGSGASAVMRVVAPIDGVVTALNVGVGAVINDATTALLTISNLDQVWVTVDVPENLVANVAHGQAVSVMLVAYPGRSFTGKVGFVSPILDADTRRTRVRVPFANPGHLLKPNMYASAVLDLPRTARPDVPASALLMNNDSTSVFVEVAPWTFERRRVELGREDGDRVVVRSGLQVGERIVVRGGVLLND